MQVANTLSTTSLDLCFVFSYAGHQCEVKGCGHALVIDGNMKNHRDICFATCAGYVEYKGLPGRVQSGCPNTPDYKSHYCSLHKLVVAIPQKIPADQDTSAAIPSTSANEDQVGLIISERVTRSSTLYEVSLRAYISTKVEIEVLLPHFLFQN